MKAVVLLTSVALAAAMAACSAADGGQLAGGSRDKGGDDQDPSTDQPSGDPGKSNAPPSDKPSDPGATPGPGTGTPAPGTGGATPTPTPGVSNAPAKDYFFNEVYTSLQPTCAACHGAAGPGPAWFFPEKDKTYVTFENLGYISNQSRIVLKGVHGAAPALTAAQVGIYNGWVAKELAARGNNAPTNIKEKLGNCFDEAKFNAIGVQALRVTRRNNENANNCTGCANNTLCMTCHTSDAATGVILANGNNNVPANHTFTMAKALPYMDLFIGTNGTEIVGSKKLALKSEATVKDKPYSHPMYTIPATMQAQIDAFALDISTKYKAGQCR